MVIPVDVPVIAYPAPQESNITWSGPDKYSNVRSTLSKKDVNYKYVIHAFISIENQHDFGTYTMKHNGVEMITVTIHADKGMSAL